MNHRSRLASLCLGAGLALSGTTTTIAAGLGPAGQALGEAGAGFDQMEKQDPRRPGDTPPAGTFGGRSYAINLQSASGEVIAFQVHEPQPQPGVERYPLLLNGHGFGGSRTTEASGRMARLMELGYGVISIDQRGHNDSSGTIRVMDPDFEGRDLVQILDWAETHLDWLAYHNTNAPASQRSPGRCDKYAGKLSDQRCNLVLGAWGGSYGGGFQFLLLSVDQRNRLDAMLPVYTWSDLDYSLNPGGVLKSGWAALLFGSGERGSRLNMDPYVRDAVVRGVTENRLSAEASEWLSYHGMNYACERRTVQVPDPSPDPAWEGVFDAAKRTLPKVDVFLWQATRDTLFNLNEAMDNYDCLKSLGGDVRLYTFQMGHNILKPGPGIAVEVLETRDSSVAGSNCGPIRFDDVMDAWFDEKLRGNRGAVDNVVPDQGHCLSLSGADAVFVTDLLTGGTAVEVAETPVVNGAGEAPVAIELPLGQQADVVLAGIPVANLTVTDARDAASQEGDPILFVGLGRMRANAPGAWDLVDNQVMPVRGLGSHEVKLVGVNERLAAGDRVALLVYGYHDQYGLTSSRDLSVPVVKVSGRVELPVVGDFIELEYEATYESPEQI